MQNIYCFCLRRYENGTFVTGFYHRILNIFGFRAVPRTKSNFTIPPWVKGNYTGHYSLFADRYGE